MLTPRRDRAALGVAATAVGAVLLLNLPWLTAAVTTSASGRSDPAGVGAFAVRAENWSGPFGALAGTGGIWNAQTTPASRGSALVPVVTAALLVLGLAGFGRLRRRWLAADASRLAVLAGGGFVVAALGATSAGRWLLAASVERVPGAGLLRDGPKFLVPYALLLAVTAALGAERVAERLAAPHGRVMLVAMMMVTVAVMPDLAFGGWGALRPVRYPSDWDRVAGLVAASPGELLPLPLSEYRRYAWNHNRVVIDVAPRYLPVPVTTDDTLAVGPLTVWGEDRRAAQVRVLLTSGAPVAATGVRWALVEAGAGGAVPDEWLAGMRLVYKGQFLSLYENSTAAPPGPVTGRRWIVVGASLLAMAVVLLASWRLRRRATAW